MNEQSLARGLSFFSLGLGLAELLAPRQVARLVGVNDDHDNLIRMMGLREITSGLGIMQGKPGYFLWSRVAGDAMDLGLLAAAARSGNNDRRKLNAAMIAVAGVTALDIAASILASGSHTEPGWRIRESEAYESGFDRGDPIALRACCDDAMAQHTRNGHQDTLEDSSDFESSAAGEKDISPRASS